MIRTIVFAQDTLTDSGTERSHLQLFRYFSPEIKVHVVYFYPDHTLLEEYKSHTASVTYLGSQKGFAWFRNFFSYVSFLRQATPDLMVSSLFRSNLLSRMASVVTGVPLIGTMVSDSYGEGKFREKSGLGRLKHRFIFFLDYLTSGIPVHWIANSNSVCKALSSHLNLSEERVTVIHRGRDSTRIPVWKKRIPGDNQFRFVYFGRLNKGKGLMELLTAFAQIQKKISSVELWLIGEGRFRTALERSADELGISASVSFQGYRPNAVQMITECDCFIFPSWYEGFSGALIEAMMSGIPIIASDIPMNLEALKPNLHGLVFPVRDTASLTRCMITAIDDQKALMEMGQEARQEALRRFDLSVIASQYEQVLMHWSGKTKAKK